MLFSTFQAVPKHPSSMKSVIHETSKDLSAPARGSMHVDGHVTNGPADAVATNMQGPYMSLQRMIQEKSAKIGVVGLGYVGLPLAVEFAHAGFQTLGIDLNEGRVKGINGGRNYISDVSDEMLEGAVSNGKFKAEHSFDSSGQVDVFFICVPTPVTPHKDPDASFIESSARSIATHLRAGQLIILKSTTYPGTTENLVLPILNEVAAERGLILGRDFFVAYSPERIDPGNEVFTTANTPVVVGGATQNCTEIATLAMKQVVEHVHVVSSPRVAEMEKLLENIFRSVNIALVNEMARLCDRMGDISIWEVVEAAATKPFGFMSFLPGPGLGGHCIPVDPYYLSWVARRYDFETSFITLSARVNESMPFYVVEMIVRAVAQEGVRLRDAKVLILGVAFKRDVDDIRHSPSLRLIELLHDRGIENISYADPHVSTLQVELPFGETLALDSQELTEETLRNSDVVVVSTDHSAFSYDLIATHAKRIVDTRNALENVPHDQEKVVLLGGGNPPPGRHWSRPQASKLDVRQQIDLTTQKHS